MAIAAVAGAGCTGAYDREPQPPTEANAVIRARCARLMFPRADTERAELLSGRRPRSTPAAVGTGCLRCTEQYTIGHCIAGVEVVLLADFAYNLLTDAPQGLALLLRCTHATSSLRLFAVRAGSAMADTEQGVPLTGLVFDKDLYGNGQETPYLPSIGVGDDEEQDEREQALSRSVSCGSRGCPVQLRRNVAILCRARTDSAACAPQAHAIHGAEVRSQQHSDRCQRLGTPLLVAPPAPAFRILPAYWWVVLHSAGNGCPCHDAYLRC